MRFSTFVVTTDTSRLFDFNSIDAATAVKAATSFDKPHKNIPSTCDPTSAIKIRDAAIHMAFVDADLVEKAVGQMTMFINGALKTLNYERMFFWGTGTEEEVDELITRSGDAARLAVQNKIKTAKTNYETAFGTLDARAKFHMLEFNRITSESSKSRHALSKECPSCENDGWYELDVDVDVEPADGDYMETAYWIIDHFECPFCKLQLDADELVFAGIHDDPNEMIAECGFEYDEDSDRDR